MRPGRPFLEATTNSPQKSTCDVLFPN